MRRINKRTLQKICDTNDIKIIRTAGHKYDRTRYIIEREKISIEIWKYRYKWLTETISRELSVEFYRKIYAKYDSQKFKNLLTKHKQLKYKGDTVYILFFNKEVENVEELYKVIKKILKEMI